MEGGRGKKVDTECRLEAFLSPNVISGSFEDAV